MDRRVYMGPVDLTLLGISSDQDVFPYRIREKGMTMVLQDTEGIVL